MVPRRRPLLALSLLWFCTAPVPAVELILYNGLVPSGDLSGAPNQLVGWGFSLENEGAYWVLAESTAYVPGAGYGNIGVYLDLYAGYAEPVPPYGSVTVFQDPANPVTGLGTYRIDAVAVGSATRGFIELTYSLYTADPFTDPAAEVVASGLTRGAGASVSAIPLPATPFCLVLGLGPLAMVRRSRRRGRRE